VLYPSISYPPSFYGPKLVTVINEEHGEVTDFYFECRIEYKRVTEDDGARFDVVLVFDGEVDMDTLQSTTSLEKTVVFNSTDLRGHFGTEVSKLHVFIFILLR